MKKKYALSFLLVLSVLLSLGASAFAWMPDHAFHCSTDPREMPENTVYIDLLLPIGTEDEGYVPFNQANGEKYGISPDSEIVRYNEGGYVSYTFHMTDADSQMHPYYICYMVIPQKVYAEYRELLKAFDDDYSHKDPDNAFHYSAMIEMGSCREERVRTLEAENEGLYLTGGYWDETVYTMYNESMERESEYDFEYCCKKYRQAKMAYLDGEGNILGVSSPARIKANVVLNLCLSGEDFSSDPKKGPPVYLLVLFVMAVPVVIVVIAVVVAVLQIRKRQERAKAPTDK